MAGRLLGHSASVLLESIAAPGKRDAWAVGSYRNARGQQRPLVLHWDGARWARYAVPGMQPSCAPTEVTATSPGNVWIFCAQDSGDVIHRWNGASWHTMATPPGLDTILNAVVLSPTDAWVRGAESCSGSACTTTVWRWDGTTWSPHAVSLGGAGFLAGAGTQVAVIGHRSDSRTAAFRWTGTKWRAIPGPYHDLTIDPTIAVSPSGELWIQSIPLRQGSVVIHQWRSGTWHAIVAPNHLSGLPMEYQSWLSYDGHEGVWSGATAHWTGRRWINAFLVALPPPESASMNAFVAPVPGTTSTWGLGNGSPCQTRICPRDYIAVFGTLP